MTSTICRLGAALGLFGSKRFGCCFLNAHGIGYCEPMPFAKLHIVIKHKICAGSLLNLVSSPVS